MKADIDVALAIRKLVITLECRAQALALLLQAKWHDERIASERCRAGCAFEIVGHHNVGATRLRDMDVAINTARQDEFAGSIQHFAGGSKIIAERCDLAV